MRRALGLLALAAVSLLAGETTAGGTAEKPRTFTGTVIDNQCGANCATYCPLVKGIRYTLQSGDEAFVLSDQKKAALYSGKRVQVQGTLTASNRLILVSITPAK